MTGRAIPAVVGSRSLRQSLHLQLFSVVNEKAPYTDGALGVKRTGELLSRRARL